MPAQPIGSIQTVVVCVGNGSGTNAQKAVCGGVGVPAKVQAYLLDASQAQNIEAALGPFDYGHASQIYALGFSTVVGLYFVAHGIGLVLGLIRRG